jgi:lipopolysaccharide transport system permease protein
MANQSQVMIAGRGPGEQDSPEDYLLTIRPHRSWLKIDWADLAEHSDLLRLLVRRDLISKYKQTVLGPLWWVVQPVALALVFTVVFGHVVNVPTNGVPRILFNLCSLLGWTYFAQNLNSVSSTFISNAALFGKVYFPRLISPFATTISNLCAFFVQFGVFFGFYIAYKFFVRSGGLHLNLSVLLLPLLVLETAAFSLGAGLWLASLTGKYRDLSYALPLLINVWMFLTPVFYPLAQFPKQLARLAIFNPMSTIVESFRKLLLGVGTVTPEAVAISVGITLLALLSGIWLFQRAERTIIDTI